MLPPFRMSSSVVPLMSFLVVLLRLLVRILVRLVLPSRPCFFAFGSASPGSKGFTQASRALGLTHPAIKFAGI